MRSKSPASLVLLFCRESDMLQNTVNTSFKIIYNLPYATHRYFVQSVSGKIHTKIILMKRFLGCIAQIERSPKKHPLIRHGTRRTTGSNIRNIILLLDKASIDEIRLNDIDNFEYTSVLPIESRHGRRDH